MPRAGLAGVLGVAALVRALALFDDFWIDEIWSLTLAGSVHHPLDVITLPNLRVDNNHPLNTLILAALGSGHAPALYRLPAALAGVGASAVAYRLGLRRGRVEAVLAGGLVAISPLLVAYTTEARGYAFALLAAFIARWVLERLGDRWTPGRVASFGGLALVGWISHLSFGHAHLGFVAGSARRLFAKGHERRRAVTRFVQLHAVPALAAAAFLWIFARNLRIGGGPRRQILPVLGDTLGWLLGVPPFALATTLAGLALAAAVAWDVRQQVREGSDAWVGELTIVLVAPALTLLILTPPLLYPRYFLIAAGFTLLALARALARAWERGGRCKTGAAIALGLIIIGQTAQLVPFLRLGCGEYAAAIRYVEKQTASDPIRLAGDHDFRVGLVVDYHRRVLTPGRTLEYVLRPDWPAGGTEWYIRHDVSERGVAAERLRIRGVTYRLERRFGYHAPAGFVWWVYHRESP